MLPVLFFRKIRNITNQISKKKYRFQAEMTPGYYKTKLRFGLMFLEYKNKVYWWEFIKMYEKILIMSLFS